MVHQRLWYVMSCLWESAYIKDTLLLIGKSGLYGDSLLPLKKYITTTIWLMSLSRYYANRCALEVSLNKTNFPFLFSKYSAAPLGEPAARYPTHSYSPDTDRSSSCPILIMLSVWLGNSGPQLIHHRLWYVMSCLWENSSIRFLAAYKKE